MKISKNRGLHTLTFVIVLSVMALVSSCKKDSETPNPTITSISPASGVVGTVVTITGDGFSDNAADLAVSFGTTAATIQTASVKVLVVQVPSGVAGGNQDVTVKRGGKTATSPTQFNVVANGIASFSPTSGPAGTVVTITGAGFDPNPANNTVTFGTTPATVVNATSNILTVLVPANINGSFTISVKVGSNTYTSATQFNSNTQLTADLVGTPVANSANNESEITSNTTLDANIRYTLKGWVYVTSGATLTIPAGTVIKGDKATKAALIVEPGAKIIAQGTATNPIVFTSNLAPGLRNYGDWGGVVLVGNAPANKAQDKIEGGPRTRFPTGTNDASDNSGTLSYVRIEYAGVALSPNNEINGLSLYAVGAGTTFDHVQVSYANDDSIEWFGGTINGRYLIAHRGWDDDFDTDNGFSGLVQFGISTRDLTQADQSGSKAFESDNDANGSINTPKTLCVFSNITATGPLSPSAFGPQTSGPTPNTSTAGMSANYVAGVHIRRNSSMSLYNSFVVGFPAGILIDGGLSAQNVINGTVNIKSVVVAGINRATVSGSSATPDKTIIYVAGGAGSNAGSATGSLTPTNTMADTTFWASASGPNVWFNLAANNNRRVLNSGDVLTNHYAASGSPVSTIATPDFSIKAGYMAPPVTALPASFSSTPGFVQAPSFIGAIGTEATWDFDGSWVNWNPQVTTY